MTEHHSGCLLCGQPIIYTADEERQCAICGQRAVSNACCAAGHFVCDSCHASGFDHLLELLMQSAEKDPLRLFEQAVALPSVHLHGPEHHAIIPAVLLACLHNAGWELGLEPALAMSIKRGSQVPGGSCGNWGTCGAAVGAGIFASIVLGSTPLNGAVWHLPLTLSSACLARMAEVGGPRCCKRNSRLAIEQAVAFIKQQLGVELPLSSPACSYSQQNKQCINEKCPYIT